MRALQNISDPKRSFISLLSSFGLSGLDLVCCLRILVRDKLLSFLTPEPEYQKPLQIRIYFGRGYYFLMIPGRIL